MMGMVIISVTLYEVYS